MSRENSGYLVETPLGSRGRTYHSKGLVNGKVPVYIEGQTPVLISPHRLKIIGYVD